jgi:hypothetical protein
LGWINLSPHGANFPRPGKLDGRFGCVTPEEAVFSHELFAAALVSHAEKKAVIL